MRELFLTILNMSLTASYVILLVILVRLPLKKAPHIISYALWSVVGFRLVIPFSFEGIFSLLPRHTNPVPIPHDIIYQQSPQIHSGIEAVDALVNKTLPAPTVGASVNPLQIYTEIGAYIWIAGMIALLVYSLASVLILKKQLKSASLSEQNIYTAENLKTPFVLGFIRPRIYLPAGLGAEERSYILLHEQTHIQRKDPIIKILAFFILSLHWFNPLVWIAFILMSRDMELACDEKVLQAMAADIKKPYATSLLSLAAGRQILNGSPLAFGEGNVKGRIKNVLNYRKPSFWVVATAIVTIVVVGIALITDPPQGDTIQPGYTVSDRASVTSETAYTTKYDIVEIEFLSDMKGFKSTDKFTATDSKIVAYIDTTIRTSQTYAQKDDLNNHHTNKYRIQFSNDAGGYSCVLYYDTLYDKAYLVNDGGLFAAGTDFARYIDSLLENTHITGHIDDTAAVELFKTYGWTLDYKINTITDKLNDIRILSGFHPNAYYYAFNNELSKDIGLDMSRYSNTTNINVDIYKLHESMPQDFYPIQDCRGIVVKKGDKIIGAFISAGRHSALNACSLKANRFEKVTGQTLYTWLAHIIKADRTEARLSKLKPEQVIEEYFTALERKDVQTAVYCLSKKTLLEKLTVNMPNERLYNQGISLPLTDSDSGAKSSFANLKSAKLLKADAIDESDENTKNYRVTVELQYKKALTVGNGKQLWDCCMVYESPQTGWKIEGFGH